MEVFETFLVLFYSKKSFLHHQHNFYNIQKKLDLDHIANENNEKHNLKWLYIPEHPCRLLIIGGSGSGKTNALLKLGKTQCIQLI